MGTKWEPKAIFFLLIYRLMEGVHYTRAIKEEFGFDVFEHLGTVK